MLEFIEGMPADVLAVSAVGKVTHEDYRDRLIPKAEAMIGKGPIRVLYVIGAAFEGYELGALWDDSLFGLRHWHDFSQIAVVTDHAALRAAIALFKPFFHGDLRLFGLDELAQAKGWITEPEKGRA